MSDAPAPAEAFQIEFTQYIRIANADPVEIAHVVNDLQRAFTAILGDHSAVTVKGTGTLRITSIGGVLEVVHGWGCP